MPFAYPVWLWIQRNPIVLAIGAGLIFLKLRDNRLETMHRTQERREVIDAIEEQTNARQKQVREAGNRVRNDIAVSGLPDVTRNDPNNRLGVR